MGIPINPLDFPPCMDLDALLAKIEGTTYDRSSGMLEIDDPGETEEATVRDALGKIQVLSVNEYFTGGNFRIPSTVEELAYNIHVLLNVCGEIGVLSLGKRYASHFGHPLPIDNFLPPNTSLSDGLEMLDVVSVLREEDEETQISAKYVRDHKFSSLIERFAAHPPPIKRALASVENPMAPAPKRRKVADEVSEEVLESTLRAMHGLITDLSGENEVEIPVRCIEDRFETRWKVRFEPLAFSASSMLQFLKKFPKVFSVRNDGVEMVVRAQHAPQFTAQTDADALADPQAPSVTRPFTLGAASRLAGLCVNIAAESAPANADFDEKYASYDHVQQLIDIYVEGKHAIEDTSATEVTKDVSKPDPDKITIQSSKVRLQRGL